MATGDSPEGRSLIVSQGRVVSNHAPSIHIQLTKYGECAAAHGAACIHVVHAATAAPISRTGHLPF